MWAPDLFLPNDVVELPRPKGETPEVSGVSLLARILRAEDRDSVRPEVMARAAAAFSLNRRLWLFAAVVASDDRIARHRGLGGFLSKAGLDLGSTRPIAERVVAGDACVRFFGALDVTGERMSRLCNVAQPAARSFLAVLPDSVTPDIDALVRAGWDRGLAERNELRDLAVQLASCGGVLLRPFGEFDDLETGVDCLMNRLDYTRLRRSLPKELAF